MSTNTSDVLVIGGGLHGCSTALHLAMAGHTVRLLEKDHIGRHASGVNAGGVRRLGRDPAEIPLAQAALPVWRRLPDLVGDDCGFAIVDQVKVAENQAEWVQLSNRVDQLHTLGFQHEELIDAEELRRMIPTLSTHCVGGLICRGDGYASPPRTVAAFAKRAVALGAHIQQQTAVQHITRRQNLWRIDTHQDRYEAPVLVNCAGAWADRLCAQIDEPVPLRIEAPMLMITERVQPFLTPVVGATSRPLSFKQWPNGTLLIGGGHRGVAIRDENRALLNWDGLAANAKTVVDLFPCMRTVRIVRCWAGLEAVMPDHLPVIGPSAVVDDLYYAFGFSAHGFQLGPIVGRIIADLVTQGASDQPIAPFRVDRFC